MQQQSIRFGILFIVIRERTIKTLISFFTTDEIESKFNKSKETYTNTPKIFSMQKPNIIMIVLEGVAAELFESMGGRNKYTPNMDRLVKNGLLFDLIFAT